ncbi:MAG: hypothetical protein L0H59_18560 [Tomitella sp.]|nr:hypothetical protein [Tomitella sp.]
MKRTATAAAAVTLTAAGLAAGFAAPAAAEPAPQLQALGPDLALVPVGDCAGTLHVTTDRLHTPEGDVRVTLTPTGSWGTHPGCTVDAVVSYVSGTAPGGDRQVVAVNNGPASVDLHVGKGLSLVSVGSANPLGMGGGGYTWLDPMN